jgi:hypothetical protein
MVMRFLTGGVLASSLLSCAGSIQWDEPVPASVTVVPGGSAQATATLTVEGSYEGSYSLVVTSSDPNVTASISPKSAEMVEGEPLEATVTVEAAATATAGTVTVQIQAEDADGETPAGTSLFVDVAVPSP